MLRTHIALGIVPAAGSAERFGADKLVADVGGVPLLDRTVRSLLEGGVANVIVVLGPKSDALLGLASLKDPRVTTARNERPERGMLTSIQAGLRAAKGDPLVVLPGDMPYVEPATVAALLRAHAADPRIVSPRLAGKRGHPVVIPGRYRDEILAATAEMTLHDVLRAHAGERLDIDVYDRGVTRDVDRPEDLAETP